MLIDSRFKNLKAVCFLLFLFKGYPDNIRMNSDGNYYIAVNSNLINNRE